MNRCRTCNAEIRWAKTPAGKRMPLDAEPSNDGNVRLGYIAGDEVALVLAGAELEAARLAGPLYTPHFATCPDAAEHRRGTSPEPKPGAPHERRRPSAATS